MLQIKFDMLEVSSVIIAGVDTGREGVRLGFPSSSEPHHWYKCILIIMYASSLIDILS